MSVYMLEVDEDSRLGRELLVLGSRYGAGDVPNENLQRSDKGHWGIVFRGAQLRGIPPLPDALREIVTPEWFEAEPDRLLPIRTVHSLARLRKTAEAVLGCQALRHAVYLSLADA